MEKSLKSRIIELTSFSILDTVLTKALGVAAFFILTQVLTKNELGIFGAGVGFISLLSVLALRPERIFFRDFPKMKEKLNIYLSAFVRFWILRTGSLMLITIIIAAGIVLVSGDWVIALYLVGLTFAINLNLFDELVKDSLYVDFRQKLVTKLNFGLKLAFLVLLSLIQAVHQ